MNKFMNWVYKYSVWLIMTLGLVAYLAFHTLQFEGEIESTLSDWRTYVHLVFVVFLQIMMVSASYDQALNQGVQTEEFELAEELNNEIIASVNNEMADFRAYVKKLNEHELQSIREDYLFSIGDKTVEELTPKEKKAYDKLKPVVHNIYGFNLPLFYELDKENKVSYKASIEKNEGKRKRMLKKVFTGVLFGSMTLNVAFSVDNVGAAFISLAIIAVSLFSTFVITFFPQMFKLKYELPKKVILKRTLYHSFIDYKNGTHTLKKLEVAKPIEENSEKNNNGDVDNSNNTDVEDTEETTDNGTRSSTVLHQD